MSNDRAKIPFYDDLNFMIDNCEGLILDIWGVLWDGIKVYPEALTTLIELRKKDIPIILLSNAPRKSEIVVNKLENICESTDQNGIKQWSKGRRSKSDIKAGVGINFIVDST